MASSFAAASRALTARSVQLKLYPSPKNLSEQREVLRVLERFGEVTVFRSLKYKPSQPAPNTFIASFANESSVSQILNAQPIRYRLVQDGVPTESEDVNSANNTTATSSEAPVATTSNSDSASHIPLNAELSENHPPNPQTESSEFELQVNASVFDHQRYISSPHHNPLYGPFPPYSTNKSLIGSTLKDSVTGGMWASGLRDWETDVERWRIAAASDGSMEEGSSPVDIGGEHSLKSRVVGTMDDYWMGGEENDEPVKTGRPDVARAVYTRSVNRRRNAIPKIMWGLRKFKEEAEREGGQQKAWEEVD